MRETLFHCQQPSLRGTSKPELIRKARRIYHQYEKRTKRQPYVRSAYFAGSKVFLTSFWDHLKSKPQRDQSRRLKLYPCALELIQETRIAPVVVFQDSHVRLYRFTGDSLDNQVFSVQIREERKTGRKYWTSVFPVEN